MIDRAHVVMMAKYNTWQNQSLFAAADGLSAEERVADRGAFFKSIQGTLSHILWGDRMWMSRFAGLPKPAVLSIPDSPNFAADWEALKADRIDFDKEIEGWAEGLDEAWLAGSMTWFSGAVNKEITAAHALLVTHMFNHQTHHRGQVHAMLTAARAKPDDTDLMLMAVNA